MGMFKEDPRMDKEVMDKDLSESARKLNDYKDTHTVGRNEEFEKIRRNEQKNDALRLNQQGKK